MPPIAPLVDVSIVVIGRNEAASLGACLSSIARGIPVVYVDSGSTDDSAAIAENMGAHVISLTPPFSAARARNAGFRALSQIAPTARFVQMVDGDAALQSGWLSHGLAALAAQPDVAAVFGRLRERNPEGSLYNRLCDEEWSVPAGEAAACGGIALYRRSALQAAGGFVEGLIAGEEPDLCLRLRQQNWRILCIDAEMGLHDARLLRFGQWWRRAARGGHAFADLAVRHGTHSNPQWLRSCARIIFWAILLPTCIVVSAFIWPLSALLLSAFYPAQIIRFMWRRFRSGDPLKRAAGAALLSVVGKFAECQGLLQLLGSKISGRRPVLIEHKRPAANVD